MKQLVWLLRHGFCPNQFSIEQFDTVDTCLELVPHCPASFFKGLTQSHLMQILSSDNHDVWMEVIQKHRLKKVPGWRLIFYLQEEVKTIHADRDKIENLAIRECSLPVHQQLMEAGVVIDARFMISVLNKEDTFPLSRLQIWTGIALAKKDESFLVALGGKLLSLITNEEEVLQLKSKYGQKKSFFHRMRTSFFSMFESSKKDPFKAKSNTELLELLLLKVEPKVREEIL